ncbi:hypothetical protein GQ42DRAFT_161838 [Ramicandelaber brevisporus]|nr:hypothetical protein GQ42DRAFT_161838 [Ramicandelaber brevisporus]
MKLLVLLVVALAALFGVAVSVEKWQDYEAYKNAEEVANNKRKDCSKFGHGTCISVADCDECAKCLNEVIQLYKGVIKMRQTFAKNWLRGVSDSGHIQWEKQLSRGNSDRNDMIGKCMGAKRVIAAKARDKQKKSSR